LTNPSPATASCATCVSPEEEGASLDEITDKMATVADNANGLITEVQGELGGISGDARTLLAI
jgi:hypothetical protein